MPEMDALDGRSLAELLRERLEGTGPGGVTTVSVAELHRALIPYPSCREALGFATKAEYDLALLRLLEDAEVVEIAEAALAEAVREELESPEPGLAFLKDFAASPLEIRLAPKREGDREDAGEDDREDDREEVGEGDGEDASGPRPPDAETAEEGRAGLDASSSAWLAALEEPAAAPPGRDAGTEPDRPLEDAPADEARVDAATEPAARCRSCDGELPLREGVRYCPHCGADQEVVRCGRCGEVLETDWKYCPRCGGAVDGSREG